jgi:hypothetical protein
MAERGVHLVTFMNQVKPSSEPAAAPEFQLSLNDISDLFNAPRVDPFSRGPLEGCGVSGVDHLLSLLHMDTALQRANLLTLVLPADKATTCKAESITAALRRYVQLRMEREQREMRNSYRYGWRVAGFSIIMLAICLGLSALFASDLTEWMRPLLRRTFEAGFEIIGWVILWHPIQVLVFAPVAIRVRLAALRTLATLNVVIREAPG